MRMIFLKGLSIVALSAICFFAQAATIELKSNIVQRRNELRLAELAVLDGSARELALLQTLVVPNKGLVGDTVIYRKDEIAKLIAQRQSQLAREMRLIGAQRVLVERVGQTLAATEYVAAAKAALLDQLTRYDGEFEVAPSGDYRALAIPEGAWQLKTRVDAAAIRARMQVWLDIVVDGQHYNSIPIAFAVKWLQPVIVLKQAHSAHAPLAVEDVGIDAQDVAAVNGELLQDAQQLQGKRLRHEMQAGAILKTTDIEDAPAIALGDAVNVTAGVGGVVVQTTAIAERDGAIGQIIGARVKTTNERVMVQVIGEGRAIVSNKQLH